MYLFTDESHAPVILKAIEQIVNEWETLGLYLGIENEELKLIHSKSFYQIDVSRKDMICHWLKTGTATREKLIKALEDLGRDDVAAEVKLLPTQREEIDGMFIICTVIKSFG